MLRYLPMLLLCCAPLPALANAVPAPEPIDLTFILKDETGKAIKDRFAQEPDAARVDPNCDKCPALTAGHAIAHALVVNFEDEKGLDGMVRLRRGLLAQRVYDNPAIVLTPEQVTLIKKLLGKLYGTQIIMSLYPLIDPSVLTDAGPLQ